VFMIEREPAFFGERLQKLHDEERIAGRLPVYQLCERVGSRQIAAERIRDELPHVFRTRAAQARSPAHSLPALRIASSLRASGCAAVTSLSR